MNTGNTEDQDKKKDIDKTLALHGLKFPYRRFLDSFAEKIKFIHPDIISYIAFIIALLTGYLFFHSGRLSYFLIVCIILIILRMTLNTLDGLIALKIRRTSMKGKIMNALPDRYADVFVVGGIAFSSLCDIRIGAIALISMLLVSYSGMLGKAIGVTWQQHGPLDKVDRLFLIMGISLIQFIKIKTSGPIFIMLGFKFTVMEWGMLLFILLAQITVINRVVGMVREINKIESRK
jgi:archaetidylinositol phosphate synthase